MALLLANKRVLLGITGSIAAYKSADLTRRLRENGAEVRVAMTNNAQRFITPLTMQAVSGNAVHIDLFDLQAEAAMGHIELARWADVVVIAPASADFMARLAHGLADDLLTTLCLATQAPIVLAPAMNQGMWQHTVTQDNLQVLRTKKIRVLGTTEGSQACGDVGPGRMLEPADIVQQTSQVFANEQLTGVNVLITAGPTQEAIDPIRFITNASSGKMGYALAQAAQEAGANVTLISGPTHLTPPQHMTLISVNSAEEMYQAVIDNLSSQAIFIATAAVGDYRCETIAAQKIHKTAPNLSLSLIKTPDIVTAVSKLKKPPFIVGFAAETENIETQAKQKWQNKKMDMIIANKVGKNQGIGEDDNAVSVFDGKHIEHFALMTKSKLARLLMKRITENFKKSSS